MGEGHRVGSASAAAHAQAQHQEPLEGAGSVRGSSAEACAEVMRGGLLSETCLVIEATHACFASVIHEVYRVESGRAVQMEDHSFMSSFHSLCALCGERFCFSVPMTASGLCAPKFPLLCTRRATSTA